MIKHDLLFMIGFVLVFIVIMYFGVVYGSNQTNATLEMKLGDSWNCGYINTTTTLESLRDCFRD